MPAAARLDPAPVMVQVDDVTVATWVLEPPGASRGDVVLGHGTPWSAATWAAVAADLARDHRVHLWDMPGYGRSIGADGIPVDLRSQYGRLARLTDAWGLTRPAVVAHDIGGAVALGAHLLHGVDYGRLFLWDPVVLEPWGSEFFRLVAAHPEVFAAIPPPLHRALVEEYIAGAVRHTLAPDVVARLADPWCSPAGQHAFSAQIAALDPEHTVPVADRLGDVRCPVRVGWGADDPWLPAGQARELARRLPGDPAVVLLDGVGHLAQVEAPQAVTSAVRAWLDEDYPASIG